MDKKLLYIGISIQALQLILAVIIGAVYFINWDFLTLNLVLIVIGALIFLTINIISITLIFYGLLSSKGGREY